MEAATSRGQVRGREPPGRLLALVPNVRPVSQTKPSLVVIFESLINSYDGNSDISGRSLELSHTVR